MNLEKQSTNLQMTLREVNKVGEGQKNVPKLRFKGYEDAWEQRKAGDLLIERNEQAPMSIEYPLMAFIANEGVAPKGERYDRSALVTDTENKLYKRTEFGDFIYSSNNLETGSIGLNKYGKACISPVYSIFQPTGIADSDFLGRRLVRKDFINSMVKWRQGVVYGQWRIHESDFLKIEIHVPSVEEQRQIGTYLDYFDHLITLHQRKYDALKSMKKTLLSKMFPKNGEDVPEIRFKGYTDAWEQRKLGEEVQIVMGQSPKGENYTDNPEDYILVQGNADMKDGKVFPRVWTTQVTKQAHKGDIILSVRAPVGDIGKTDYDVVIGRGVAAVKGNEFFYQLLGKFKLDGYWTKSSTGSTFDSINSNEIKNAKVTIPDINEQLFIGDYFQGIDNLITLHQRKLDELKNMKKTLLQQMFV
jgi:type I restriction-modification system specificity subunit